MERYSDLADGSISKNRAGECLWYQIMHAHDDHEVKLNPNIYCMSASYEEPPTRANTASTANTANNATVGNTASTTNITPMPPPPPRACAPQGMARNIEQGGCGGMCAHCKPRARKQKRAVSTKNRGAL